MKKRLISKVSNTSDFHKSFNVINTYNIIKDTFTDKINKKTICIVTGSRSEYGLLKPLIEKFYNDSNYELKIIVTGMHLCSEFGMTYKEIHKDGFSIDENVEMLLCSDTPIGISKSMGLGMISFSEVYVRLKPDLVIVLGDRFEIFAAVSAAFVANIPVAHLHGGESTEGSIDEGFRHCITKMSYLHFTSTEDYKKRVIQLGEDPSRVFNVGAIGIDNIINLKLLSKEDLENKIKFTFGERTILVTFHPLTLERNSSKKQFKNLLEAIDEIENIKIIFTKANADTAGRIINKMIDEYVSKNHQKSTKYSSMGQLLYLSTMQYVNAVVGNSSSGIIEAPTMKIPTVNIGDRQKGRVQSKTIINCKPTKASIKRAINLAFSSDFKDKVKNSMNPYGNGDVSSKIYSIINKFLQDGIKIKKSFYDL